jgi:large subunit ribosomal protein L4
MSKIKLIDLEGKVINEIESTILSMPAVHEQAVFDAVMAEDAGRRQGTHSTLTKGEVRGGGKKPYAQKHTGNARQGSIRNPHYVGGGIVFGPKPNRNYRIKVNKQVTRLALISVLSNKAKDGLIFVLEDNKDFIKPNTKKIISLLKATKTNGKKVLLVLNDKETNNLIKSAQNIDRLVVKKAMQVSTKDALHANFIIMQKTAIDTLTKVEA